MYDSATGLYHIGARYYDPNFDRWTQMDPVYMGTMSNPQSLDGYAYALDNPVNFVDLSGLMGRKLGKQLSFAFLAGTGGEISGAGLELLATGEIATGGALTLVFLGGALMGLGVYVLERR